MSLWASQKLLPVTCDKRRLLQGGLHVGPGRCRRAFQGRVTPRAPGLGEHSSGARFAGVPRGRKLCVSSRCSCGDPQDLSCLRHELEGRARSRVPPVETLTLRGEGLCSVLPA